MPVDLPESEACRELREALFHGIERIHHLLAVASNSGAWNSIYVAHTALLLMITYHNVRGLPRPGAEFPIIWRATRKMGARAVSMRRDVAVVS